MGREFENQEKPLIVIATEQGFQTCEKLVEAKEQQKSSTVRAAGQESAGRNWGAKSLLQGRWTRTSWQKLRSKKKSSAKPLDTSQMMKASEELYSSSRTQVQVMEENVPRSKKNLQMNRLPGEAISVHCRKQEKSSDREPMQDKCQEREF